MSNKKSKNNPEQNPKTLHMTAKETPACRDEFCRVLMDNSSDVIMVMDGNGVIKYINKSVERELGYKVQEVVGKSYFDFIHPDDTQNVMKHFKDMVQNPGIATPLELHLVHKDDTERIFEGIGNNLLKNPLVSGVVVNARNITKRRKAEEELKQAKEMAELIFQVVPSGIFTVDMNRRLTSWNEATARITGYSAEEMIGRTCNLFVKEPCETKCDLYSDDVKKPILHRECLLLRKDGKRCVVSKNVDFLRDADGNIIGGIESFCDITEKKKAEEVQSSESKYRVLLENLPQKIFFKDTNSVYISCNDKYARDLKIRPNEIIGKTDYDFFPKELAEKYRSDDRRIIELGITEEVEETYVEEGREVVARRVKTPVADEKGAVVGVLGIFQDVTERKEAERKLRETQAELIRTEKLATIGQLASGMAHEINNPLTVISGETQLLYKQKYDDKYTRETSEIILEQVRRIKEIIERLLQFSPKKEAKKEPLNVNDIVEKALSLLGYQIKSQKIEVVEEFGLDLPKVFGDKEQLQIAFSNIIMNAIQAMGGGGKLTVKTNCGEILEFGRRGTDVLKLGEKVVIVEITDTGKGIDEKTLKNIFNPFFSTKKEGIGLGLSICHGIIEHHRGIIEAKSRFREGSTFVVKLPVL